MLKQRLIANENTPSVIMPFRSYIYLSKFSDEETFMCLQIKTFNVIASLKMLIIAILKTFCKGLVELSTRMIDLDL